MDRNTLMVGLLITGVLALGILLAMLAYLHLTVLEVIDLVWKALVLLFLADISRKLSDRGRRTP